MRDLEVHGESRISRLSLMGIAIRRRIINDMVEGEREREFEAFSKEKARFILSLVHGQRGC